jgi:hypothetical protein
VFRPNSDYGDRTPTDQDFVPQAVIPDTVFADLETSANPNPDLTLNYIDPLPGIQFPGSPAGATIIDIRKTTIIDSNNPGAEALLATIIQGIFDGSLVISTASKFGDGSNNQPFDFEFDSEGGKFGAGTAFLKD